MAVADTTNKKWTIETLEELKQFRDNVNNGNTYSGWTITLGNDIDLKNEEWTPIGNSAVSFNGTFDGGNHTISNLQINGGNKSKIGFFGFTQNGEVKNLTFHNAKVSGRLEVGVAAGSPYTSKYTNITLTGHVEVSGYAYVGGLGGKNAYADWTNITIDVDSKSFVKADSENYRTYVGGVIGFMGEGSITLENITSNISVNGSTCDVGGIVGIAHYGNKFINVTCASKEVSCENSNAEVGGIAGVWHNQPGETVTMVNCNSDAKVKADNKDITETNSVAGSAYTLEEDGAIKDDSGSLITAVQKEQADGTVNLEFTVVGGTNASNDLKKVVANVAGVDINTIPDDLTSYTAEKSYVASVNGVYYESLDAALAAAEDGDSVIILADISYEESVTFDIANDITITSVGGKSLTNVRFYTSKALTVDGLKFYGDSLIHVNGKNVDLTVENCYADVTPTSVTNGRASFISLGASEANSVNLAVKNNTILARQGENPRGDYYACAIFGWANIVSAEISGNTFGSDEKPYNFIAVKLMNAVEGANILVDGNKVFGTTEDYFFAAFDLYQNNSRANNYTAIFKNNSAVNVFDGETDYTFKFGCVEVNAIGGVGGNASVQILDSNKLNDKVLTGSDIEIDGPAYDYIGTNVVVDAAGKIIGGSFIVREGAAEELLEDLAVGYAPVDADKDGFFSVTKVNMNKVIVSADYTAAGAEVASGYIVGVNAFANLSDAVNVVADGGMIELIGSDAPIVSAADLKGKDITITGTALVDWEKGFLMVGDKPGETEDVASVTFHDAVITAPEDNKSGAESGGINIRTPKKGNTSSGVVNITGNSQIELSYLLDRNEMNVVGTGELKENPTLTVYGGFQVEGRPEDESAVEGGNTAVMNIKDGAYVLVKNHNGMGIGAVEGGKGELNISNGGKFEYAGTDAFKIGASGIVNMNGGIFVSAKVNNNKGEINVNKGESTLKIESLTGTEINLNDGAIVKDTVVGGNAYVAGNVTFRGDNSFSMITDFGDYYSKDTPSTWTVEAGASLTLTKYDRYGLGYGDKVYIYGEFEDGTAKSLRDTLTVEDVSFNAYGGLVAMTNSAYVDAKNALTIEDAYVRFGFEGDKSFGNKSGTYYGKHEFTVTNSVFDANGFKFYEAMSTTNMTFTGSDVYVGGVFMTNDADSKFTFDNTKVVSNAKTNGSDDKNQNAGEMILKNGSEITYNALFTNIGDVTLDTSSKLVLNAGIKNTDGKIVVNAGKGWKGVQTVVDVVNGAASDLADANVEVNGAEHYINAEGDLVIYNIDTDKVYVNSTWTGFEKCDEIATGSGKFYDVNAFADINAAVAEVEKSAAAGDATLVIEEGSVSKYTDNLVFMTVGFSSEYFGKVAETGTYSVEVNGEFSAGIIIVNGNEMKVSTTGLLRSTSEGIRAFGGTLTVEGNRAAGAAPADKNDLIVNADGSEVTSFGGNINGKPAAQVKAPHIRIAEGGSFKFNNTEVVLSGMGNSFGQIGYNGTKGSLYLDNSYLQVYNSGGYASSASLSVEANGYLSMKNSGFVELDARLKTSISNAGVIDIEGTSSSDAKIVNAAGGTVNVKAGAVFTGKDGVENKGTINLTNASYDVGLTDNLGSFIVSGSSTINAEFTDDSNALIVNSGAVLSGDIDGDLALKGAVTMKADYEGAVTGGKTLKIDADYTKKLVIEDGSNVTVSVANGVVFDDEVFGTGVAIKGAGSKAVLTVADSALNGNKITNTLLNITGVESDNFVNVNAGIKQLKWVDGNEVKNLGSLYFYEDKDGTTWIITEGKDGGFAFTKQADPGSGDSAPVAENVKSFTVKESSTELADVDVSMKAGSTTLKVANGKKDDRLEFAIGNVGKDAEKGGTNHIKVGNFADAEINGTIESMGNVSVGKESTLTVGSGLTGQSGKNTLKLGTNADAEINGTVALKGDNNAVNVGSGAKLTVKGDLKDVSSLKLSSESKEKETCVIVEGDYVAAERNNSITLGKDATLIITKAIDNGGVSSGTGTTIKLGKDSYMRSESINGLSGLTVGADAEFETGSIDGTFKNNKITVSSNAESFVAGDINLRGGKNSFVIGSDVEEVFVDSLSNVQTVTVGARSEADLGTITDVQKLTVASGSRTDATVLTAANVTGTEMNDTFNFGNYTDVTLGDVNFGAGKDTLKLGTDSKLTVKSIEGMEVFNAGKGAVLEVLDGEVNMAGVTGSWQNASIIDHSEFDLVNKTGDGTVYANEWDLYTLEGSGVFSFTSDTENIDVEYWSESAGKWVDLVAGEGAFSYQNGAQVRVSVGGDYADKYTQKSYSIAIA